MISWPALKTGAGAGTYNPWLEIFKLFIIQILIVNALRFHINLSQNAGTLTDIYNSVVTHYLRYGILSLCQKSSFSLTTILQ